MKADTPLVRVVFVIDGPTDGTETKVRKLRYTIMHSMTCLVSRMSSAVCMQLLLELNRSVPPSCVNVV